MSDLTAEALDDLAELLDAATDGPWHADRVQVCEEDGWLPYDRGTGMWFTEADVDADGEPFLLDAGSEHDAALIVALRNHASALIAAARERDRESARAQYAEADYDRRGERLWRLASLAGHEACHCDNDASAEIAITVAITERDAARAEVAALRERMGATVAQIAAQATCASPADTCYRDHDGCAVADSLRIARAALAEAAPDQASKRSGE